MFFNKKDTSTNSKNWINFIEISQIDEVKSESFIKKIIVFKHSSRCSISNMALRIFEKAVDFDDKNFKYYFLDLITYRNISNAIAVEFQITHQSPQVLVIENGICVQHASHEAISEMKL